MSDEVLRDDSFADAIRRRRKNMPIRLGVVMVGVLVFLPVIGPEVGIAWLAAYFLMQGLEVRLAAPVTSGATERLGRLRGLAACTAISMASLIYAAFTLPLWSAGGMTGGVCAALILAGGMMNALMVAGRSSLMLTLNLWPYFLLLIVTPPLMLSEGAPRPFAVAAAVICVALMAFVVAAFGDNVRLARSERRAQQDSDRRRREAEAAIAGKSAFVASVSHDLRTPLSAILTGAHDLEKAARSGSARDGAALISEAGLMMKALLDDLLDHARLEAGRMEVDVKPFDMRQMLARTVRLWQREAADQGLKLRIEGATATPRWVSGDPVRIRQILNNLISNALKFTQDGAVTIRVQAWDQEPDAVAMTIEVIDTGPGMDAAQLARLFTPFDQTESGVSGRHGGSGLGLSISRDLARLMGGWLTVRSHKGEGATFTLALALPRASRPESALAEAPEARSRIPRNHPLAARPPEPIEHEPEPDLEPMIEAQDADDEEDRPLRILVVDDHEINRRAIQLILAPLGGEIASAADGLAALAQAEVQPYDVIFMDVRMPELDGRETTRRLRRSSGLNRTTPVIAVTADTGQDDIDACMAAGMDYFVSKPLTPTALLDALSHVMDEVQARRSEAA